MKRLIGLAALVLSTLISVVLISLNEDPEPREEISSRVQATYEEVQLQSVSDLITGQGQVRARWRTTLASEVSGRVTSVADSFLSGLAFSAGDVLVSVEPTTLESSLASAQASLAEARRNLLEEQQRARIAEGSWSASGLEGSATDLVMRRPQVREARAQVEAADAAVASAEYSLSRADIEAPYDGIVINRTVNPGDYLQPGSPVGEVFDRTVFEIVVPLTASQIDRLRRTDEGAEVWITGTSLGVTWAGALSRIEQTIDAQSRWRNVVVEVSDTEGLNPGQFVEVQFSGQTHENILRVRERHIASDGSLWLIEEGNVLRRVVPEIVFRNEGHVYVRVPMDGRTTFKVAEDREAFLPGMVVDPLAARPSPMSGTQLTESR